MSTPGLRRSPSRIYAWSCASVLSKLSGLMGMVAVNTIFLLLGALLFLPITNDFVFFSVLPSDKRTEVTFIFWVYVSRKIVL
jgi:hypothetical protein